MNNIAKFSGYAFTMTPSLCDAHVQKFCEAWDYSMISINPFCIQISLANYMHAVQ